MELLCVMASAGSSLASRRQVTDGVRETEIHHRAESEHMSEAAVYVLAGMCAITEGTQDFLS